MPKLSLSAARERARACALFVFTHHFIHETPDGSTLRKVIENIIADTCSAIDGEPSERLVGRFLEPLKMLVETDDPLCSYIISDQSWSMGYDREGLNACSFTSPEGETYLIFRGTGNGEWNDNGVSFCGLSQSNVYYSYDESGKAVGAELREDFLSTQQAQTLDFVSRLIKKNGWENRRDLIVGGHSKGGNKAQLTAMFYEQFAACISINGQGFSPEAIAWFKNSLPNYEKRLETLWSFCRSNDFINGLGDRIVPDDQFITLSGPPARTLRDYHEIFSVLDSSNKLSEAEERGRIALSTVKAWELVRESKERPLAARGLMDICEMQLGSGMPVNGEYATSFTKAMGALVSATMYLRANVKAADNAARAIGQFEERNALARLLGAKLEQYSESVAYNSSPYPECLADAEIMRAGALELEGLSKELYEKASSLLAAEPAKAEKGELEDCAKTLALAGEAARANARELEETDVLLAQIARWTLAEGFKTAPLLEKSARSESPDALRGASENIRKLAVSFQANSEGAGEKELASLLERAKSRLDRSLKKAAARQQEDEKEGNALSRFFRRGGR
ncbi:MAG: hypothetical protein Q4B42_02680 [Oscillospiraceae bacterium]|nr:hypothetical protein [Oscillospiraceae bacterium]